MTNKPIKLDNFLSGGVNPPFAIGSVKPFGPGSAEGLDKQLEHNRTKEILELEAKLKREEKEQAHKQTMDITERTHARNMNIGAAGFIALLVLMISVLLVIVSFGITIPGIKGTNDKELQKLAISSLGPLAGLSIGFFSGKIKWPG